MIDIEQLTDAQKCEFVAKSVDDYKSSDRMRAAEKQRAYYDTENPDIMSRKKWYAGASEVDAQAGTFEAVATENRFAANEKIASSFFRDITDSKVQYLAGEGADVNSKRDDETENAAIDAINDELGEQVKRVEQECMTDALVYSRGYAYMQVIGGAPKLQYMPFCEVIPYRDKNNALDAVLRYWKRGGAEYAEYHTKDKVYEFERVKKRGEQVAEWAYTGERWQIETVRAYADGSAESMGGKGWQRLPWFELKHNNDGTSSLTNAAVSMIKCYDLTVSDFANNLIDIQDTFITLKNSGSAYGIDFGEQLELLRTFKFSDADYDVKTVEIPHEARKVLLDMLKADIYAALRGVDVGRISSGNLTNTAIRALYSDIDLWADQAEWHVKDWITDIYGTYAAYKGVELPPLSITLQRRAIFDEVAQMDAIARQKGVISDKTIFENHPLVKDAQAELERVDAGELDAAYSGGL